MGFIFVLCLVFCGGYFPTQNFEKIDPKISVSTSTCPVMEPICFRVSLRWNANKSPEVPYSFHFPLPAGIAMPTIKLFIPGIGDNHRIFIHTPVAERSRSPNSDFSIYRYFFIIEQIEGFIF